MFNNSGLHSIYKHYAALFVVLALAVSGIALPGTLSVRTADATGSTITVTGTGDSGGTCTVSNCTTLRAAISAAVSKTAATTINFSFNGTITVGSVLTIGNSSTNPITIDGIGHTVIVDGGNKVQVFNISSGASVTLQNLTIQHGSVSANYASGGGIANSGTATINNSTISGNSAVGGGGISNGGTLTVSNSTISGNTGPDGGGGISNGGTMTVSNSVISGNSAIYGNGGGIWNGGTMTVSNSTISGNIAGDPPTMSTGNGGGIANDYGAFTFIDSTISGNSAMHGAGGGIVSQFGTGALIISNSTISGNSAIGDGGGGIASAGDRNAMMVSNSTISGNSSNISGGGIGIYSSTVDLLGVIVANNTGTNPDIDGNITSLGHNLIGDTTGAVGFIAGDQLNVNPMLGTLASNGGPTQTMAIIASSPAFGKGDCSGNTSVNPPVPSITSDQRGFPRKTPCDVGAYETFSPKIDTIGIFRSGTFYLRLHNSTGNADLTVAFTAGTKPYPIVGDWTGSGFDTVGVFDQNNGQFSLRDSNTPGTPDQQFVLGSPNDQPLSGRWLISATNAGVGVFRPSNGLIYLKNALSTGFADYTMVLGIPGDVGLAGDWNGKGFDSPGVYRSSNSTFYLSNKVINGSVIGDYQFAYGVGGDAPVNGDWIAQGYDGVGLFRQSNGFTYLKNQLVTGYADNSFTYGIAGDIPVAGHWQAVYPPIPPASVLRARTAVPSPPKGSIDSSNPIGD